MSAFALPALALARRAADGLAASLATLEARSPGPDVVRLESTGPGAGVYVADALATPALHGDHPRFVIRTRNGRLFRLLPQAGAVTVEQGGALGDGVADDRDAIQATIAYAEAIGAGIVRFEASRYRLHCPLRSSPADKVRALDGHPLVIRRSLRLEGRAGGRTVLDFKGLNGEDPVSDFQLVPRSANDPTLVVWRGGGLFVDGDPAPQAEPSVARLEIARLAFMGNRPRSGVISFPANPATGDGWDITDKAIWVQDCHVGDLILDEVDCVGWRGEIVYFGGSSEAVRSVTLTRCRFLTSDGTAFNPGVNCRILARDCEFGDAYQGQEETGKSVARYSGCLWRDCDIVGLGSGPTAQPLYNFAYPTRDPARDLPLTELDDCTFRSVRQILLASWVRGRIRTVDSQVMVNATFAQAARDVDLEIDAWLDRGTALTALSIFGPSSLTKPVDGAPEGVYIQPPRNVRFRIRHYRTDIAEAAGENWRSAFWNGYVHRSCRIVCEGDYTHAALPHGETDPVSMPYVSMEGGVPHPAYTPEGAFPATALTHPAQLKPAAPIVAVGCANDELVECTLLANPSGGADYGYAPRQKLRLVKRNGVGQIRFSKNAAPWYFEMLETRVLTNHYDWIEFVYHPSLRRWEETGFFTSA